MSAHFCAFYQPFENPFRDVYRNRVPAGFVAVRVAGVGNKRPVVGESLQTFAFERRKAAYFASRGDGVHARGVQRIAVFLQRADSVSAVAVLSVYDVFGDGYRHRNPSRARLRVQRRRNFRHGDLPVVVLFYYKRQVVAARSATRGNRRGIVPLSIPRILRVVFEEYGSLFIVDFGHRRRKRWRLRLYRRRTFRQNQRIVYGVFSVSSKASFSMGLISDGGITNAAVLLFGKIRNWR